MAQLPWKQSDSSGHVGSSTSSDSNRMSSHQAPQQQSMQMLPQAQAPLAPSLETFLPVRQLSSEIKLLNDLLGSIIELHNKVIEVKNSQQ